MTQRERQLLEWIRENPLISQQELADKAGITRSSAAVHISNLMKKGYIAGRGYLLRERALHRGGGRREYGHRRGVRRAAGGAGLQPRPGDHVAGRRGAEHRPQPVPAGGAGVHGHGAGAGQLTPSPCGKTRRISAST